LPSVEVHTFYPSTLMLEAVIKLIKSCRMKQACKIPHVDTVRDMYTVLLKHLKAFRLGDLVASGRIILKMILEKYVVSCKCG